MVNPSRFASDPWIDKPWGSTLREKLPRFVHFGYINWGAKERQQVATLAAEVTEKSRRVFSAMGSVVVDGVVVDGA